MLTSEQQVAAKEILSSALSESRPAEVLMVKHCFDHSPRGSMDGMLGFGFGDEYKLALPVLLHLLTELAKSGGVELAKHWGQSFAHWLIDSHSMTLDANVLENLGQAIARRLEKQGISSLEAATISDSVLRTMIARPNLVRDLMKR
jgi:hypothetical protein